MAVILTGHDKTFAEWAGKRIATIGNAESFGKYTAVGVATGKTAEDRLMAVIVFHDYSKKFQHCQVSVASSDARWVARNTIRGLLSIPFLQYGCNKVYAIIPQPEARVLGLGKALGFIPEATLKDHFGKGTNAIILRMLARDYDRIYWSKKEKKAA